MNLDQEDWQLGHQTDDQPLMSESDPNIRGSKDFK